MCFFHLPNTGVKASLVLVKESKSFIDPTVYPIHMLVLDRNKVPFGPGSSSISGEGMNCSFSVYRLHYHCCTLVLYGLKHNL